MKFGPIEVFFNPGEATVDAAVRDYLRGPAVSEAIARMARSEVKNYLAEQAEKARLPFRSPEEFLKDLEALCLTALMDQIVESHEDRL